MRGWAKKSTFRGAVARGVLNVAAASGSTESFDTQFPTWAVLQDFSASNWQSMSLWGVTCLEESNSCRWRQWTLDPKKLNFASLGHAHTIARATFAYLAVTSKYLKMWILVSISVTPVFARRTRLIMSSNRFRDNSIFYRPGFTIQGALSFEKSERPLFGPLDFKLGQKIKRHLKTRKKTVFRANRINKINTCF